MSDQWDGVYGIVWAGSTGVGGCVAKFENGKVAARDGAGISYAGHVEFDGESGALLLHLQSQEPAEARVVTGISPLDLPLGRTLSARLPVDFADIKCFPVSLPSGDIDIMCRRIDSNWAEKIGPG